MDNQPFTRAQAQAIANTYQHLIGAKLDNNHNWVIDAVAVTPTDKLNQWLFAHLYMDNGSVPEATTFGKHTTFDVILISVHNKSADLVAFKDIRTYLQSRGEALSSKVYELRYTPTGGAATRQQR